MKKIVLASLLLACLPYLSWAQNVDDDLYFIPKKKTEKKASTTKTVKENVQKENDKSVYVSNVVVKDVSGKTRDVDEYNRRFTSKDNKFSLENDTLYIEEKPYNERGEWVNGFDGSRSDYEYAMRIVRFRNPRYAIPASSPLYWDVLYGLSTSQWNIYDDGFYAYVFPTYSNQLWWDWRWNYPYGSSWGFSHNWNTLWYDNWYYSSWDLGFRYGWNHYYGYHNHLPGTYWGVGHYHQNYGGWRSRGVYDNRRAEYRPSRTSRTTVGTNNRTSGRVVNGSDGRYSVRPQRTTQPRTTSARGEGNVRSERSYPSSYTRPSMNNGTSSYTRPSSTRSSVREGNNALNRSYNSSRSRNESYNNNSYNSSRSSYQSNYQSSGSSSRSSSSYRSSSSSSRSSSGGGARRR